MSAIATAIVGSAVVGGVVASKAASKAADAQKKSAELASNTEWDMYEQTRKDQMPWLEAGQRALTGLEKRVSAGPGAFTESPGYQFRLGEGVKALERGAAARGNLLSGSQQKALTRYGQDYASNEYQNFLNQYYQSLSPQQSLAGVGQSAATTLGGLGAGTAGQVAQNQLYGGQARASGYINQANVMTGALQGGMNALGSYYGAQPPPVQMNTLPSTPAGFGTTQTPTW